MKSQKNNLKVLEVPVTSTLDEKWDEETSAAVAALENNPGFIALNQRLRFRSAILETMLKKTKHSEIRDVDLLQAGIFWAGWLQATVDFEVAKRARREVPRDAYDLEQKEFERMKQALTVVGLGNPSVPN